MKIKFLGGLLSLALCCSTALPTSAQEKDQADSFLYRAIPANPELAQQLDVINRQLDEAFNKHDAVAVAALFTVNAILMAQRGFFPVGTASRNISRTGSNVLILPIT